MRRFIAIIASLALLVAGARAQFVGAGLWSGTVNFPVPDMSACNFTLPTTFGNTWYIDPINGHTQNSGADGSAGNPWNSLQAVFSTVSGYPRPLLSTATGGTGASPIKPGDEILLMTSNPGSGAGSYGSISTGTTNLSSGQYVVISGATGQSPILNTVTIGNSRNLAFTNLSIGFNPPGNGAFLVFGNSSSKNIVFDHDTMASDTYANQQTWTTQSVWHTNAFSGPRFGAATCTSITNSHIFAVINAITNTSATFEFNIQHNEIDHFGADGIDYEGTNQEYRFNFMHDAVNLGALSPHIDFMQGQTGGYNIRIDSNTILLQTDPNLLFAGGAGFDGAISITNDQWSDLQVTNNIISFPINFSDGISIGSANDMLIANNTIPDAGINIVGTYNPVAGARYPSQHIVVKNNLVAKIAFDVAQNGLQSNNNVISNVAATNRFACNGSIITASTAGSYGCNNTIDVSGNSSEITAWNNTSSTVGGVPPFTYNAQLLSTAPARNAGTGTLPTPQVDQNGHAINSPPDAGALQFLASPPSWVASICPNNPLPQICMDFVNNRAWDGLTFNTVPITNLLSITRAGTESYQNASGAFSSIPSNTLALGNAGLQIQGQTNQLDSSTVCASATGGTCTFKTGWSKGNSGALGAPSNFVHNTGDAPDGTDSDTIQFPAVGASPVVTDASFVISNTCATTIGQPVTISFYAQAVSSNPVISAEVFGVTGSVSAAGALVAPPASPNWQLYSMTATASTTTVEAAIGALGAMQILFTSNNGPLWGSYVTGGTVKLAMLQCNQGTRRIGNVATTGTPLNTALVDNISAIGDLATALHSSSATVRITTGNGTQGVAGTLIGNSSAAFLGKNSSDQLLTTSSLNTTAMGLWNNNSTYNGVSTQSGATPLLGWSSGSGQLNLNGSVVTDTNTRSMSGTVFLGTTDGTASPWNGNILSMEVDSGNATMTPTASQPITGITYGGFQNYNGQGATTNTGSTYAANVIPNYNLRHNPTSNMLGDTWANAWASDGNTYLTGGDSEQFLSGGSEGVFFGSLPSPAFANPPPIGSNGVSFHTLLGTRAQATGPCPSGASLGTQCEWKPATMLALNATAAGTAHDVNILWLSRQWESGSPPPGPYGATYSTIAYDSAEGPPWSTLADWQGFPATQNANVANPTFNSYTGFPSQGIPYPFGFAAFVSNGKQDYNPVSGDPNSLNEYIYAVLSNFVSIPGQAITVRIALADIQSAITNLNAVDGSGNPSVWCYYGQDAAWHGGGTGCTGTSSAWSSVGTTAQNVTPNAGTNGYLWSSVSYVSASNRYLMTGHNQLGGGLVTAESPTPWGPYNVISNFSVVIGPSGIAATNPAPFYDDYIINSSVATDGGRNIWLMPSGNPAVTNATGGLYTIWQMQARVLN